MQIHRSSPGLLVLIAASVLLTACASTTPQTEISIDSLVTTDRLGAHLDDPDLVVLDCTVSIVPAEGGGFQIVNGRAAYDGGHIASAGFADLMGDLADGDSSLHFAVPTPQEFAAAMGRLGVGDDSRVVLYDRMGSGWAARVWWMLRWIGFDRAAVLDGGWGAWTAEGRPQSNEPAGRAPKRLTVSLRPEMIADRDEVLAAIDDDSVRLIDAMPEAHFRGEMALYDRPGHIPGASNIPAMSLLDESGRYRPDDELAAMFEGDHDARTITYCGGGISASSAAFIMTRLGFDDVAVYTASLQEWAADPDKPLVAGTP
ncbi:MAG: sulfurtransferase [Acidobacteriota bacterium]